METIAQLSPADCAAPVHRHSGPASRVIAIWLLTAILFFCAAASNARAAQDDSSGGSGKPIPDTMQQRLLGCAACHGEYGEGVSYNHFYPRLSGKSAEYLYHQLKAFQDGRRHYSQMIYLVRFMDDAYMHQIADYYASQDPRYEPPLPTAGLSPQLLQRGEALALHGDSQAGVPACIACHGAQLQGRDPGIPRLLGMSRSYLTAQLGGWKDGVRQAIAPDCMREVADKLSAADIEAVGVWIATQAGTDTLKAEPASGNYKLPLACGSVQ
jgi:cytochrome c553